MPSFRCPVFLLLAATIASVAVSRPSAPSTKVLTFMSLTNREWKDFDELEQDKILQRPLHDKLDIYYIPIYVPALDSLYNILIVEKENDTLNRVMLMQVTEDPDGTVRLHPFNLKSMDKLGFNPHNPPFVIDFKPEELVESPRECDALYVQIETNVFFGQFPDCRDSRPGEILRYNAALTCSKYAVTMPTGALEVNKDLPYLFTTQTRYPLPPQMLEGVDNFTVPCNCS